MKGKTKETKGNKNEMKEWNTKSEVQKQIKEKPNQKKERRKDG